MRQDFPGIASAANSRLILGIKPHESSPPKKKDLLSGVIEGFYGQPWTMEERFELFKRMARLGLNTYLYAPKDDLKHRALWRQLYDESEVNRLQAMVGACAKARIRFIYALAPGLDIKYSKPSELVRIQSRLEQMVKIGCKDFAMLFDDIPDQMDSGDVAEWGTLAGAQCFVTNKVVNWLKNRGVTGRFLFCPTPYCGRMAARKFGGVNYLETIGRGLVGEIDILWTGPEIISREVTVEHIRPLQKALRRKPVIWDNLHANDYDGRRFFCGPYSGRPTALRKEVGGLLSNPNTEYPLNDIPIRTLAEFVNTRKGWNPRKAYLQAMREWLHRFAMETKQIDYADLLLFGDCFYLPHEEGPEAKALFREITELLSKPAKRQRKKMTSCFMKIVRLRELCVKISELKDRPLFYALSRRAWDLREELDLIHGYLRFRAIKGNRSDCRSDFHLPGTFRGGMIARLQSLLRQRRDGTFVVNPTARIHEFAGTKHRRTR